MQSLFHRNRSSLQPDQIQFHPEQQIAENLDAGISLEEARYAAIRPCGRQLCILPPEALARSAGWRDTHRHWCYRGFCLEVGPNHRGLLLAGLFGE